MDRGYYVLMVCLVLSGPVIMMSEEYFKSPQERKLDAFKECMKDSRISEETCKELTK